MPIETKNLKPDLTLWKIIGPGHYRPVKNVQKVDIDYGFLTDWITYAG